MGREHLVLILLTRASHMVWLKVERQERMLYPQWDDLSMSRGRMQSGANSTVDTRWGSFFPFS